MGPYAPAVVGCQFAAIFNLTGDICGEARLVERAFGLGVCALAEAAQLLHERLEAA